MSTGLAIYLSTLFTQSLESSLASHDTGSMTTRSRRNAAVNIDRTNRFDNIDKGLIPFKFSGSYENRSSLNVRDAVILCQKAYYNFSIFRHTIDLMTEFSGTKLFYTGGTKKGKEFVEAFFNKVGVKKLIDQFFREYYRSGNVFIHRFSSKLLKEDFLKITKTYGAESLQGLTNEFEAIVPTLVVRLAISVSFETTSPETVAISLVILCPVLSKFVVKDVMSDPRESPVFSILLLNTPLTPSVKAVK